MKKIRNYLHIGDMKLFGNRIVAPVKGKGYKKRPRNSNRSFRINGNYY